MMETEQIQRTNRLLNTVVYIDYDNISELLKQISKDPLEMEFFRIIQGRLQESEFKVIDFIVYGNFEKDPFSQKMQTLLQGMGFQARHVANNRKSSGDLEITVDALRKLYRNPNISVFVFISNDRDIIPLLKTIRYENRIVYVYSTKNGFNQVVAEYADYHEYIEDIFQLDGFGWEKEADEFGWAPNSAEPAPEQVERAKEVSRYFYNSNIWRRSLGGAEPIHLNGYIQVISHIINRSYDEILNDFMVAHRLEYVKIYQEPSRHFLLIKQGERGDFW